MTSRTPLRLDIDRSVTLRQLRTFVTVADLTSFSLAAIRRDWHIVHLRRRRLPAAVLAFMEFLRGTSWLATNGARGRMRPPTD